MHENYELTPEQKKIWQIQKAWNGTDICNVGGILRLSGKEDADLLARAVGICVQTQSAFWIKVNRNGKPYFEEPANDRPEIWDFTDSEWKETEAEVQRWMYQPFCVEDHALFELRILKLREETVIYGKFHHLIVDSYGISLFVKAIEQIYLELAAGREVQTKDLRFLQKMQNQNHSLETKYKKEESITLTKEPKREVFFEKRARKAAAGILAGELTQADWYEEKFDTKELNGFCRKRRISSESLLYAALAVCLCRLKNGDALRIGRNLINRGAEERNVIGMYVDTRGILLEPDFSMSAGEYAARVKQELALQAAGKREDPGRFDVVVSYRPLRYLPSPKEGSCSEYMAGSAEVPLKLFFNDDGKKLELIARYQKEVFTRKEAENLIRRVVFLMHQMVSGPEIKLKDLQLLETAEKRQIAERQGEVCWKYKKSPAQRYLDMAEKYPDLEILLWHGEKWTYRRFHRLVTAIAGGIRQHGDFTKDRIIGLCLKRSPNLPASMYAAWLCGCAYLPVSIYDAESRKEKMAGKCALFLTDVFLEKHLKEQDILRKERTDVTHWDICPDGVAYQMYTSGTTGEPKAVQISHRSLSCRLEWMADTFQEYTQVILQKTRNTFDVSNWELLLPLSFGKLEVLTDDKMEASPEDLAQIMQKEHVTMLHFVPSMFEQFLSMAERRKWKFPDLKCIILSGEAAKAEDIRRAKELWKEAEIFNLYGPTECTIDVSFYRCTGKENEVPIGRPLWNTSLTVQNDRGDILPVGEKGELVIRGELVGIGYEENGLPSYRTGDLAVWKPDGYLYYLGRKDRQVKIRGIRVNLSEAEKSLEQLFAGSRHVVLCIREQLIDFFEGDITAEEIREKAAEQLPYYEVPSEAVRVSGFPLGKHGKIDHRKLELQYLDEKKKRRAKRQLSKDWEIRQKEEIMIHLAEELLAVGNVTEKDNLLDLGMDSIDVLRFQAECECYGIFLEYAGIYAHPTIHRLAKQSTEWKLSEGMEQEAVTFLRMEGKEVLFLMIPFAGGSPAAFWRMRNLLSGKTDLAAVNPAVFGEKSIEKMADEILKREELQKYQKIYLLGDCVGSALAIELAGRMEKRLEGLILCEALPYEGISVGGRIFSIWDFLPDQTVRILLQKIRGKQFQVGDGFLKSFRRDVRKSAVYLKKRKKVSVSAPVTLVFGMEDPLTSGYQKKYKKWRTWIPASYHICRIAGKKHFLTEDAPAELGKLIETKVWRKEQYGDKNIQR